MTSSQETEWVYSYNPEPAHGDKDTGKNITSLATIKKLNSPTEMRNSDNYDYNSS